MADLCHRCGTSGYGCYECTPMTNTTQDDLSDLRKERAEYADIESDCQEAKKYVWHGGFLWRLFDWIERTAAKNRLQVNQEITELKETPHD